MFPFQIRGGISLHPRNHLFQTIILGYPAVSFRGCKFRLTKEHVGYENPNIPRWKGMENGAFCFKDLLGGRRYGTVLNQFMGLASNKK